MDPHSTGDLFSDEALQQPARREQIGEQSYVLRGYALPWLERVLPELRAVLVQSPFRHMVTPGGYTMSAALSSCGALGWTTSPQGYRYSPLDPERQQPWPSMPVVLRELAINAASAAGFDGFAPDACLINRYVPGARMSLHQDKNERDYNAPVVSLSLACRRCFCLVAINAATRRKRSRCSMATWRSGAALTACVFMGCCRSRKARTRAWGHNGST